MPFLGGSGQAFEAIATERIYLTDFAGTIDEITIFADSDTGNDANTGYNEEAPVLTLQRAMQEVANLSISSRVSIRLTGSLPFNTPVDGLQLPPIIRGGIVERDFADLDGFSYRGPVRIYAPPSELQAIPALNVTGQVTPDNSGLITIQTNLVFVPGAFVGKWVVDALGVAAQITSNTAANFDACHFAAMTPPLRVLDYGAVIQQAAPGVNATIRASGSNAPVILQGLQIQGGGFGFIPAVEVDSGSLVILQCCNLEGLWVGLNFAGVEGAAGALVNATRIERNIAPSLGRLVCSNCFFEKVDWTFASPLGSVVFTQSQFRECDNGVVFDSSVNNISPGFVTCSSCRIVDASIDGIKIVGAGSFEFSNCNVSDSAGIGALFDGSCSGKANDLRGAGNGAGLSSRNGAQVQVNVLTTINTGDPAELTVGSIVTTWALFRPAPKNIFDVTALVGELARVWEP